MVLLLKFDLYRLGSGLVQVGFKSTRYYWSYRQMNRRCRYVCRIEEDVEAGRPKFVLTVLERGREQTTLTDSSCTGEAR